MLPDPTSTAPTPSKARDLRAADRLATFLCAYGSLVIVGLAVALLFRLDPLADLISPAFVPSLEEIVLAEDWNALIVHGSYALYGGLMLTLGLLLRRKVIAEAFPAITRSSN